MRRLEDDNALGRVPTLEQSALGVISRAIHIYIYMLPTPPMDQGFVVVWCLPCLNLGKPREFEE